MKIFIQPLTLKTEKKNAKNKWSIRMFVGVKNEGYLC